MAVIDQVSDVNGTTLLRLSNLHPLPEFVKSAERITPDGVEGVAVATFGDRANRRFPCHTKSSTYLSWLYFLDNEHEYPEKQARDIRGNMDRMAAVWNLSGPNGAVSLLKQAVEKRAASIDSNLTDNDFALVQQYGGNTVRRLPIYNPASVKKAAEALYRDRARYPYAWRKAAAQRIDKQAAAMKVELADDTDEYIQKAAGYGGSTAAYISDRLHERASVLRGFPRLKTAALELSRMAESVRELEMTRAQSEKIASFLDEFDRRTGLHKKYAADAGGLPVPEEVVFSVTEKSASAYMDKFITLTSGQTYAKDDLEKAGVDVFAVSLGDDIEDMLFDPASKRLDIQKAAEILPTLPRDDAASLADALYAVGVSPVDKQVGLDKAASVSYDACKDLGSWKQWVHDNAASYGSYGTPNVITRADELAGMHSDPVRTPVL